MSLFDNRYLVTRLRDVELELAAERATRQSNERELTRLQATLEWLTTHVNELKTERAMLFQRALQVSLPVPEIQYTPQTEAREMPGGVPMDLTPDVLRQVAARVGAPVQVPANGKPANTPIGIADLTNVSFEDVGDVEAAREGIRHDRDGELAYEH